MLDRWRYSIPIRIERSSLKKKGSRWIPRSVSAHGAEAASTFFTRKTVEIVPRTFPFFFLYTLFSAFANS